MFKQFCSVAESFVCPGNLTLYSSYYGHETEEGIVFRKSEPGKDDFNDSFDAAAFFVKLKGGLSVKYGFGTYQAEKDFSFKKGSTGVKAANHYLTVSEVREHFESFLKLVLPEVVQWDEELAKRTLDELPPNGELPPWLILRLLDTIPETSLTCDDGNIWDVAELCGLITRGAATLTKASGNLSFTIQ